MTTLRTLLIIIFLLPAVAYPCSMRSSPFTKQNFFSGDTIFYAKVIEMDSIEGTRRGGKAKVKVLESFRGKYEEGKIYTFPSSGGGGSCGANLRMDGDYLFTFNYTPENERKNAIEGIEQQLSLASIWSVGSGSPRLNTIIKELNPKSELRSKIYKICKMTGKASDGWNPTDRFDVTQFQGDPEPYTRYYIMNCTVRPRKVSGRHFRDYIVNANPPVELKDFYGYKGVQIDQGKFDTDWQFITDQYILSMKFYHGGHFDEMYKKYFEHIMETFTVEEGIPYE